MSIDVTALPSEVLVAPQPLVGFCGLDVTHNAIHKSIWDAFSTNRKADRPVVQFKLLPATYEFPVAKPKRASYEWYHPKGILKRNWMLKHLHVLPSVVVLFHDLEWSDVQWTEKQVQCASMLQQLKNALQERNTRICLVLLQRNAPMPPGEDMLASERAASLTTACGINTKMLFILPHTEHLMGYTLRLESAFLDMAQTYYALMSKRIRTHRDQLTATHVTLKIRHQFKLGFVAECRQDLSTALKHYTQAYSNMDEIRITDTNCLEIKTVAGFLNYKICRLMFKLKVPRDAINHFISHIEKYKNRVGFKDLIFEHYAWLSSQHSAFAELFCEAIKNGLPALQTQHPGIYFHKAAEYVLKRKEAFLQSYAILLSPTEPTTPTALQSNSLVSLYTEFYGIRAMKTGEPITEQQINNLIRDNEKAFNHSSIVISLLSQAMAQFKIYKCLRFRKKLAIDMAEEYFKSGDHAKALTLYSLMLPDYRQDKWMSIFSDVLLKTLRSALLSASVTDYISCSIEALSLKIRCEQKERIIVLENLWKVFQSMPPISPNQVAPEIRELWENAMLTLKSPVHIDLDKITELFELCATFECIELKNDAMINVHLIVRLLTDVHLKLRSFALLLTDGVNTFKLPALKYATFADLGALRSGSAIATYKDIEGDLRLESNTFYQLRFSTEAQQFMENTQLRVTRIEALMGTDKVAALLTKNATFARNPFRYYTRSRDLDDNITINTICYITPTFHLVTQTNIGKSAMLVNEYHAVETIVSNPYNVFLQNVVLNINIPNELRNKVFLTTDIQPGRQKLHSQIQIDIGELTAHSTNTASYYIFSLVEAEITLQQKIWYTLDVVRPRVPASLVVADSTTTPNSSADNSPETHARTKTATAAALATTMGTSATGERLAVGAPTIQIEYIDETQLRKGRAEELSIKCGLEFQFSGRFYTLDKKPLAKVYRGENFLLRANIEVQARVDIDILETYFICDHNLMQSTYSFKRKKYTNAYRAGDKLEDVIVLRTHTSLDEWQTVRDFERSQAGKQDPHAKIFRHRARPCSATPQQLDGGSGKADATAGASEQLPNESRNAHMIKSLMGKIPTNMTIISNTASAHSTLLGVSQSMNSSFNSDDGRSMATTTATTAEQSDNSGIGVAPSQATASKPTPSNSSRLVYNKAIEAIQATGHCRGFIKGVLTTETHQQHQQHPLFGVYCIKWRRSGSREENESKFVINGLEVANPPLNIYCTIEEKMYVKMPMTFRVVLKNPTARVIHLVATLSISNTDNFICSGHKQLDISIFAYREKELVYNLYPLCVGWQNLPELTLEYNTQSEPNNDETQNHLLSELVQRSIPKKVFVLMMLGCPFEHLGTVPCDRLVAPVGGPVF